MRRKDRIIFDNTPGAPPGKFRIGLTNADRIRAMSDEELAAFLEGLVIVALGDCSLRDNKRRLDWLKQEVKE